MFAFVVLHLLVAMVLPALAARATRVAFLVAAVLPGVSTLWMCTEIPAVLGGAEVTDLVAWAPRLGLEMSFRLDPLAIVMTILVSGLGTLILLYARSYFAADSGDARRSAPLLLAFAGAMLGVVLADDLLTLYVFWELTTICSFLLVGQAGVSRRSRRAALQALMITTLGGLVMLLGFIVLGESAGTYRISEIIAAPPGGTAAVVSALLILVGAFTKSAQLPFHNWLPTAMVAPTPISAYLHAASMVKAGVFLVARLAPVYVGVGQWWFPAVVFGLVTMLFGGWRALHETDLKILLAYGTVSQLGFLMTLVGAGTHDAALAGAAMVLAHGMFKATLFLVVGIVDHQAGTRDLRELSGLGRRMPWVAAIACVAAASMAGVPLTLGFLGKEAAFAAFLDGEPSGVAVAIGLVLGSVLTVGYSLRLVWGAFAAKTGVDPVEVRSPSWGLVVPAAIPAIIGLLFGVLAPLPDALAAGYARAFDPGGHPEHLALWHGLTWSLLGSLVALLGGVLVHRWRAGFTRARDRLAWPLDAQRGYERIMALLERTAVGVTGRFQVGSLPSYIGIILTTVLIVPGGALLGAATMPDDLRWWDAPLQLPLAVVILVAAIGMVRAQRRLTSVILVGAIGYSIGGLFIIDGGPDLALALFLVETLTLVAFVLVLRQLPVRFTQSESTTALQVRKAVVASAAGVFIAIAAVVFSAVRNGPSPLSQEFIANAHEGAGASNVVNAIIVDFRAFDTVGELSVLAVAATGVASLVLAARFDRKRRIQGAKAATTSTDSSGGA